MHPPYTVSMMDELANSLGRRRTALLGNKDKGEGGGDRGGGGGSTKWDKVQERLGINREEDQADKGVKAGSEKIVGLGDYIKSKDGGSAGGSGSDDSDWD